MRSKVLIVDFDLFRAIGGGQTVYGGLIHRRSDLDFLYLRREEAEFAPRPVNARALLHRRAYAPAATAVPSELEPFLAVFRDCMDIASSVRDAGVAALDVVDVPDYRYEALFIRYALEAHGVKVGAVALALHGVLSSAFVSAWPWSGDAGRLFAELHLRERLQFRAADVRYGLSDAYIGELQRRANLPVNRLDPLTVIRATSPTLAPSDTRAPDVVFIGRKERRKGPDLLLDALWWAPPGAFGEIRLIGPDGVNHQGGGSVPVLDAVAKARGLRFRDMAPVGQEGLRALCRDRTILAVPSRYDQFNLVALEALLDGCPTLISPGAGAARWIAETLPQASDMVCDFACDRSAAIRLADWAMDYDRVRGRLVEQLHRAALAPDFDTLQRIYDPGDGGDRRTQDALRSLAERFMLAGGFLSAPEPITPPAAPLLLAGGVAAVAASRSRSLARRGAGRIARTSPRLSFVIAHPRAAATLYAKRRMARDLRGRSVHELELVTSLPGVADRLKEMAERSGSQRRKKTAYLDLLVEERQVGRARWFSDLARLERLDGRGATAAAYELRLMRWLGSDRLNALSASLDALRAEGFAREADAAQAIFGPADEAGGRVAELLQAQRARWRDLPDRPLARLDDRRGDGTPKVSVVVSLYDAADKLATFLRMLAQQTLVRGGQAEVVLVDSASPGDEFGAFDAVWRAAPFPVVYARSAGRETIQTAWNRGIRLARGEHLAFLGVDEGLHPQGLELLSRALDEAPEADWAMADALVTEVDRQGRFARDVMVYDRSSYRQPLCYLDSTYLAYVGGMYRRSLHDRFGWYDEDFRAAGDTEFKNRILPFIRTVRVPRRLGVFNNYPQARASQSPRAELEDLRAWYLHRTPGGMADAFQATSDGAMAELLSDCLAYRKCYSTHPSTDLDLARSLLAELERRGAGARWTAARATLEAAQRDFVRLDAWPTVESGLRAQARFAGIATRLTATLGRLAGEVGATPEVVDPFRDNRYEQHHWSWSAA